MTKKTIYPITHIVSSPGILGGRPRIDGTRVTVQFLAMFINGPYSIQELCEGYSLTPAQIHAAWSYYYDHQTEIDHQRAKENEVSPRPDEVEYQAEIAALIQRRERAKS